MGRNFSEEFTNEEDITVDSDSAAGRQLGGRTVIVVKFIQYHRPDRYIDEFDSVVCGAGVGPATSKDTYPFMITHLLPIGLKGLVTAAMLAAGHADGPPCDVAFWPVSVATRKDVLGELRDGRLGDEARAGDLRDREPAEEPERERHLGLG